MAFAHRDFDSMVQAPVDYGGGMLAKSDGKVIL